MQNYDSKVVAVSDECTNENFSTLPKLGSINSLNIEQLCSLSPSAILIDENCPDYTKSKLQALNIPLVSLNCATDRQDLQTLYTSIGRLIGWESSSFVSAMFIVPALLNI